MPNEGISRYGMSQDRDPISIWRVYMPIDVDREVYIRTCYATGRVTLINENAEVKHKIKVGKLALQVIDFPDDINSFGSEVICVTAPYSGELYVVDVYASSKEMNDQEENQYRLFKASGTGFAELRIDGGGRILLSVESEDDGGITISVSNKNKDAVAKIQSNGSVLIDAPKIIHSEGAEEAMLLGNTTIDLLGELLDVLNQESAGPYTLRSKQKYVDIKNKLEDLLSEISYLK